MDKCHKCGHDCHCGEDCQDCVNDVCYNCDCDNSYHYIGEKR
jgi:hypothetical protein